MLVFPNKLSNIYPSSDENIQAVLLFYFKDKWPFIAQSDTYLKLKTWILGEAELSMNQLEFCCRVLKYNFDFFDGRIKNYEAATQIINLLSYTKDAISRKSVLDNDPTIKWASNNRIKITFDYRVYILKNYQQNS